SSARALARAASFCPARTASSKSTRTTSAPLFSALGSISGLLAGTYSEVTGTDVGIRQSLHVRVVPQCRRSERPLQRGFPRCAHRSEGRPTGSRRVYPTGVPARSAWTQCRARGLERRQIG